MPMVLIKIKTRDELVGNTPDDQTNLEIKSTIQQLVNNYVSLNKEQAGLTAASVTVQCNSIKAITVYAGTMGRGDTRQIQNNSLWQIGSNTKSFTAIVLLQLENEYSNFSIEDDITKWGSIPDNGIRLRLYLKLTPNLKMEALT